MVDKIEIINGVIKWVDLEGSILSYVILTDEMKIRIFKFNLGYNVEDYEEVKDVVIGKKVIIKLHNNKLIDIKYLEEECVNVCR